VVDLNGLLKLVHVFAAIVAVGANVTYAFWMALAGQDRAKLVFAINGIRRLDSRVANPAYVVLALTGVPLVIVGRWSFTAPWIWLSIVLYLAIAFIGITLYAPAIRVQLRAAEEDPGSEVYGAAARRSNALGLVTLVVVSVIVGLMVLKPGEVSP
jgi:uncharacterized membrane protein